jgi:hypothetical protein
VVPDLNLMAERLRSPSLYWYPFPHSFLAQCFLLLAGGERHGTRS